MLKLTGCFKVVIELHMDKYKVVNKYGMYIVCDLTRTVATRLPLKK